MTNQHGMDVTLRRAYELAASGCYSDAAMVDAALAEEGFIGAREWIDMPSIRDALTEICLSTRRERAEGAEQAPAVVAPP
jgi:hypothetical protein